MAGEQGPESVETTWSVPVLVCSECSKRTSRANAPGALRKWLRKELRRRGRRRRVRVLETSCLDVCPKSGVTVSVGGGRAGTDTVVVHGPEQWPALADLVERAQAADR